MYLSDRHNPQITENPGRVGGGQLPRVRSENTNILEGSGGRDAKGSGGKRDPTTGGAAARACCGGRSEGGMSAPPAPSLTFTGSHGSS